MKRFFFTRYNDDPINGQEPSKDTQAILNPYPREKNTIEGGEFLDDAIRMTGQPFGNSEEKEEE